MPKSYYKIEENQNGVMEPDILSVFRKEKQTPGQIRQGMPQDQIVDIVSEKLMEIIKIQFEEVKKQSQKGN